MTAPPGEHERLISDWRERLDRIKDEQMRAHLHQYVWTSMRDEIQKHPEDDGTFLISYSALYVGSQMLLIRRLADSDPDAHSLASLVSAIRPNPKVITRTHSHSRGRITAD